MLKNNSPLPSILLDDYCTKEKMFTKGLILSGLLSRSLMASRIEARSTTAGTPVKSYKTKPKINKKTKQRAFTQSCCNSIMYPSPRSSLIPLTCSRTRAGLKGISTCFGADFAQSIIFSTSSLVTWKLSQFRMVDSKSILIEYGSLSAKRYNIIKENNEFVSYKGDN